MLRICKRIYFILFLLLCFSQLKAQLPENAAGNSLESIIEEMASNSDEELDFTSLYDDLQYYFENPLNINTATEEDLSKFQILTDFQIKSFLLYRKYHGSFLSIYELQFVDGYNFNIIGKILPFISLGDIKERKPLNLSKAFRYGNHQLFIRTTNILETAEGYNKEDTSGGYIGNSTKLYAKYKFQYKNNISYGITMEKDAGEEFLGDASKYGFDYYSMHFLLKQKGFLKTLAVGDYSVRFGQGLVLWSGMGAGKSAYVLNTKKHAQGISKYASTDENNFLRGLATTLNYKDIDITFFGSKNKIDANITQIDTISEEVREISSLQNSGFHRTQNEIIDKDALSLLVAGSNLVMNKEKFRVGATFLHYQFDAPLEKEQQVYNQFTFTGKENNNFSIDYQFSIKELHFFGETAGTSESSYATINGVSAQLAPQVSISAIYRDFAKDYNAMFSNAFAENSTTTNEKGFYIGTEIFPVRKVKISAYADRYKFPWLKSTADAPTSGTDYLVQIDYSPTRSVSMYVKYKDETKEKNQNYEEFLSPKLINYTTQHLRYHISYQVVPKLFLKTRLELSFYTISGETENGYLMYQDVQYKAEKIPLTLTGRFAIFQTDSYNTRIYAYENDVLYGYSIPAYYSKGTRAYLNLKYSLFSKLDIWIRLAQTYYADKATIGSGLDEINSNTKTEVKFQIRYKF